MSRPKLLDLFCGAGGAGEGYRRAGFDVVGVDIEMHDYPCGEFVVADALAVLNDRVLLSEFDAIHASPPCQGYTTMSAKHPTAQAEWPKLIGPVREALQAWGGAYVIENVVGAKREIRSPVMLSGGMFDLHVDRPRLFESNITLTTPPRRKPDHIVGVYGRAHDGRRLWTRTNGTTLRAAKTLLEGQRAMGGMYWMNWHDLNRGHPVAVHGTHRPADHRASRHRGRRMSRALGAPLLTKWARLHGGRGNRIRHAGNYTGMSVRVSKLGAQMKTAPGCANTNRGLDAGKERLMMTILPAWSDSQREARD